MCLSITRRYLRSVRRILAEVSEGRRVKKGYEIRLFRNYFEDWRRSANPTLSETVSRLNSFLLSISVAAGLASFSCRATFAQSETLTAIPPAQSTATQPLQAAAISGSQPAASNPLAQAPQGPGGSRS